MINIWLEKFKICWIQKDIDGVLELFDDNVEYWESPFKELNDKKDLWREWQAIKTQDRVNLKLSVYSSVSNKHVIVWQLLYAEKNLAIQNWAGVYLVKLNEEGKCIYFQQVGERLR